MQNPPINNNNIIRTNSSAMDVALALAQTTEILFDITNCIQIALSKQEDGEVNVNDLLNIRDSLKALEDNLSSLQALQLDQLYRKQAFLAEVEYSRQKLLQNLKAYKDDDLEVIHEAIAFASPGVEMEKAYKGDDLEVLHKAIVGSGVEMENNDLPPYPTSPTFSSGSLHQSKPRSRLKGLRQIIGAAAKMLYPAVGFIAVLHLSGFELRLRRRGNDSKVLGMAQEQGNGEKTEKMIVCPPGKVLVVENGVSRCLVKEQAEIPFKSVATVPDLRNWFGQGSLFN